MNNFSISLQQVIRAPRIYRYHYVVSRGKWGAAIAYGYVTFVRKEGESDWYTVHRRTDSGVLSCSLFPVRGKLKEAKTQFKNLLLHYLKGELK